MGVLDQTALNHSLGLMKVIDGVEVKGTWQKVYGKTWAVQLRLRLLGAEPSSFISDETDWILVVDFSQDSWGKTTLYPAKGGNSVSATFPHQMFNGYEHDTITMCRSGFPCTTSGFDGLSANRNAIPVEPSTTIERIVWHVQRGLEWLQSAAQERLSLPGSPFELPDYNFGRYASSGALAFFENEISLKRWDTSTVEAGVVELAAVGNSGILATKRFLDAKKREVIYEPEWGNIMSKNTNVFPALWVRLPELPVVNRWQAPCTVAEMQEAFGRHGRDFNSLLEPLWNRLSDQQPALLLIGSPIPKKISEPMAYMHWQSILMAPVARNGNKKGRIALIKHHMSMQKHSVSWLARSENWHSEELQSRGRLSSDLCDANVLLLGAGSLGSNLGELLVRMGVRKLKIVDDERFEAGNLVRHTLTTDNLNQYKAEALAIRLNKCSPSADISFSPSRVPHSSNKDLQDAMDLADLVIDATANDDVLRAMPLAGLRPDVPIISCSLSLESKQLFFYAQTADKINWLEFDEWYAPYRAEQDRLVQQMDLPRGVGCWHPLTPARLNRIQFMSGVAVELIESIYLNRQIMPAKLTVDWFVPSLTSPDK